MLFGIHWDCIPEKNFLAEVRRLNVEGKVIIPDGLKRVAEYFWGSKSLQIVEADCGDGDEVCRAILPIHKKFRGDCSNNRKRASWCSITSHSQ